MLGAGNLESKFLRQIPLTYHIKHRFHFFFSVVSGIDPKNERKNHEKVELSSCRPTDIYSISKPRLPKKLFQILKIEGALSNWGVYRSPYTLASAQDVLNRK